MIVAVAASGCKDSNSTFLAETALAASGVESKSLHRLANLSFMGCTGCGACRAKNDACVLDDGLTPVLADVARADALILSSPNYYGYVSGIFKSFLDRWYSFRDGQRVLRIREGRPLLMVMSQGHPDPEAYEGTIRQLERIYSGYGFLPQFLVAPAMERPGEAPLNDALAKEARRLGALLASSS